MFSLLTIHNSVVYKPLHFTILLRFAIRAFLPQWIPPVASFCAVFACPIRRFISLLQPSNVIITSNQYLVAFSDLNKILWVVSGFDFCLP